MNTRAPWPFNSPVVAKRPPMADPVRIETEGPFPPPIVIPWWAFFIAALVFVAFTGALLRLSGVI